MGEGERSVAMEKLKVLKVEYEIYKLVELKTLPLPHRIRSPLSMLACADGR